MTFALHPDPGSLDDEQAASYRRMLFAAGDIAHAVRTEDPGTIRAVLWNALGISDDDPTPMDPQRVVDLILALAVQVDVEVPVQQRAAWCGDIDAINDPPVHQRASMGYAGSGSYGVEENDKERSRRLRAA